jgi:hypothetical protein
MFLILKDFLKLSIEITIFIEKTFKMTAFFQNILKYNIKEILLATCADLDNPALYHWYPLKKC